MYQILIMEHGVNYMKKNNKPHKDQYNLFDLLNLIENNDEEKQTNSILDKMIDNLFFKAVLNSNKYVEKESVYGFLLDHGIDCKMTLAKKKMLELIKDYGLYEKFFNEYYEYVYVPSWSIGEYFGMESKKIDELAKLGVITEDSRDDTFWSKKNKCEVPYKEYLIEVLLNHTKEELQDAYENAYPTDSYALRVETKTKEEVQNISKLLGKIFLLDKDPASYEHRNEQGYYTYYRVKIKNDTKEMEDRLLAEIVELKEIIRKKDELIEELRENIVPGYNDLNTYHIEKQNQILISENSRIREENRTLKEEVEYLKTIKEDIATDKRVSELAKDEQIKKLEQSIEGYKSGEELKYALEYIDFLKHKTSEQEQYLEEYRKREEERSQIEEFRKENGETEIVKIVYEKRRNKPGQGRKVDKNLEAYIMSCWEKEMNDSEIIGSEYQGPDGIRKVAKTSYYRVKKRLQG